MSMLIYRLILLARTYSSLFAERATIGATCLMKIDNQDRKGKKKINQDFDNHVLCC